MNREDREQLKANTVNDPKFWFGLISFAIVLITFLIGLGQIKEQLKRL